MVSSSSTNAPTQFPIPAGITKAARDTLEAFNAGKPIEVKAQATGRVRKVRGANAYRYITRHAADFGLTPDAADRFVWQEGDVQLTKQPASLEAMSVIVDASDTLHRFEEVARANHPTEDELEVLGFAAAVVDLYKACQVYRQEARRYHERMAVVLAGS